MRTFSILVILPLLLAGCGASSGDHSDGTLDLQNHVALSHSASRLESTLMLGRTVRISAHRKWASSNLDIHLWHPDSSESVSGGDISINGMAAPRRYSEGATWYQNLMDDTIPLAFDGSYHVFNVPGGPGFPPFVDSIRAPYQETSIMFPGPADTISRSSGFTLTWSPTDAVDGVFITVADTSVAAGSHHFSRKLTANTESLTISPSDLAGLAPGPLTISVTRGNVGTAKLTERQGYKLAISSTNIIMTGLVP